MLPTYAFHADVPLRPADFTENGVLHHSHVVTVMEEARVAWLLSAGDEYRPLITSAMIVTVDVTTQRHLCHTNATLRVGMWIEKFRSVDFHIGYHIRDSVSDDVAYRARTQMAVVDMQAHTLRRLTDAEKAHLRQWSTPPVISD